MKPIYKRLTIATVVSLAAGCLGTAFVARSENGYFAGFVALPVLLVYGIVSVVLLVYGLVTITKPTGPFLLLAAVLIPAFSIGSALLAKHFEVGAYREEPMRPIVPSIANKVIFKKDATHEEVQNFWSEVLSDRVGASGKRTRPGIQGISSNPPENGHEVVTFSFFENATEAQIADVRSRILAYPPVDQYLENVDTSAPVSPESSPVNGNSATRVK